MKRLKYFLCVLLACITVLGGGSSAAFAVSSTNLDNTPVLQDLQESTINGEKFDAAHYPYNEQGEAKLLAFTEFCFSYKAELAGNYALYVYVYNPTGREIRQDKNSIQIADLYANGNATHYKKYNLRLCNSSAGGLDKLFYKFRVIDDGSIFERVCKDNTARRYDVSGIELNYTGTAEDFTVGNKWVYSGFAKGCGADENADSTLSCITDDLETVRLEVKPTYYRYNNGIRIQTQISSVYFGVDNALLKRYGTLQKIHAEWLKAITNDIAVIDKTDSYQYFKDYIGIDVADKDFKYSLYTCLTGKEGLFPAVYWGYNIDGTMRTDKLAYLIDKSDSADNTVSSEELQEYIKWYSDKFGNKTVAGKYSGDLFVSVDENKTDVIIDADSHFDINGFTTGSGLLDWFNRVIGTSLEFDDLKDKEPIYLIKESDLNGSNEEISKRLLVAVSDVNKLKADFAINNKAGKATVLFRFATSDYTVDDMAMHHHGDLVRTWYGVGYKAQETVYLDFDIIDLTFIKNDVATVIPVVSNPLDIIAGITPPPVNNDGNGGVEWWVWVIIVALTGIVFYFFADPIISLLLLIFDGIVFVIRLPFRLIGGFFGLFKRNKKGKEGKK